MTYTVIWKPTAEQQLATIWMAAADREAVTSAANTIDSLLRTSAETFGESRTGNTRFAVVPPLAVHFDVLEEDRKVNVLTVHCLPTKPPSI